MALTCPTDLTGVDIGFDEFIDCSSVSINYDLLGVATVGFTVIASKQQPNDTNIYTDLTFGGVRFTGYITALEIRRLAGTLVYEHRYTLSGVGCYV